jgi:exonuclease III
MPDLVCTQETKLADITPSIIKNVLGANYDNNFVFVPAAGTRGGILLLAHVDVFLLQQLSLTENTITTSVLDCRSQEYWKVIRVYGPQGNLEKKRFIRELRHIKQPDQAKWLLMGDIIYMAQDKNNGHLNR